MKLIEFYALINNVYKNIYKMYFFKKLFIMLNKLDLFISKINVPVFNDGKTQL